MIELAAGGVLAVVVALTLGTTVADLLHPNAPASQTAGLVASQVTILAWAIGGWVWEARTGDRLGNRVTGIRTVVLGTSRAPGLGPLLVSRAVLVVVGIAVATVVAVGSALLGVGDAWVVLAVVVGSLASVAAAGSGLLDRSAEPQGWHEKASGTSVIRSSARQEGPGRADLQQVRASALPIAQVDFPQLGATSADLIAEVPGFGPDASDVGLVEPVPDQTGTDVVDLEDSEPFESTVVSASASASASGSPVAAATASGSAAGPRLTFDTGELVDVGGIGLVGRAPEPGPTEHADHLVTIDDPDRSVSKTHLAFGLDGTGVWVEDVGSTNGTEVELRGAPPRTLVPGDRVRVPHGGTVRFGARSFVVGKAR